MADPLAWLIRENIKATLEGITIRNGYRRDVQHVSDFGTKGFDITPDAIWVGPLGGLATVSQPVQSTSVTMSLRLYCFLYDEEDIMKALTVMSSDIVKALQEDETRGNLAHGTLITNECHSVVLYTDKDNEGGFAVDVEIAYDHTFGDPDTPIGG